MNSHIIMVKLSTFSQSQATSHGNGALVNFSLLKPYFNHFVFNANEWIGLYINGNMSYKLPFFILFDAKYYFVVLGSRFPGNRMSELNYDYIMHTCKMQAIFKLKPLALACSRQMSLRLASDLQLLNLAFKVKLKQQR